MRHRFLRRRREVVPFLPLVDVGYVVWSSGVRMGPPILIGYERSVDWVGVGLSRKRGASPRVGEEHVLRRGFRLLNVELKRRRLRDWECEFQEAGLHEHFVPRSCQRAILLQRSSNARRRLRSLEVGGPVWLAAEGPGPVK